MSEQTIYPEILARIALKDTPSMVTVIHEIHRSLANHDAEQVGKVVAAFSGELVSAFREATVAISELQEGWDDLLTRLAEAESAQPKRTPSRKRK
ncbi:hypothetical protein [Eoetvoesiella caeni]|uniref:Uncharacterized protein n=1 Tax=Eoetvoesiella caeni TaxID=645616 RepID=A0A366H953_9BURK|nr:hypothetical protein [Eoetvoesiella caeni]MCI2809539.1 hypothetical protein [Eoetvoesiella caeni]NYT56035.1 hypothetical protein [Eoetvoesiella caeni]RBP38799.1 hypothetical protein DFR37_10691 [Eoetvoesiella caeni]